MKILIAPDSFKGSLSAEKVSDAIHEGIKRVIPNYINFIKNCTGFIYSCNNYKRLYHLSNIVGFWLRQRIR